MSSILKLSKNKDIFSYSGFITFTSNYVFINDDNLNLDIEWHIYEIMLIASSHNQRVLRIKINSLVLHIRT